MRVDSSKKASRQQGQILLIIVMLVATAVTIVVSVAFKSTTETQVTKLEEESQKTLSAAEAGIEAALKSSSGSATFDLSALPNLNQFSGTVTVSTDSSKTEFASPLVTKDQQYTFYLADYPDLTAHPYNGTFTFYFASESVGDCTTRTRPALEVTIIYSTNLQKKYLVESCSSGQYITKSSGYLGTASLTSTIDGIKFFYKSSDNAVSIAGLPNPKVMLVRVLYAPTRVGIKGSVALNPQGKYVVSQATGQTGVQKKVQLFQSFPQIPSDFFVTGF